MARKKAKGSGLSVFKGREAKLNRAIFKILALKGPQSTNSLYKNVRKLRGFSRKHYGNINKRVRALEELGYVKAADVQNLKGRTKAVIYELKTKAYLALMLDSISLETMLNRTNEETATKILAAIAEIVWQ
jgi:DNA-binding transcriptional ArsR family regulator